MLQIRDIHKEYKTGTLVQKALDGVSLYFRENEFVAVLGPSGSGKTTLLNIIGGLDHCDSGELIIDGVPTKKYKSRDWDAYRNHSVGFIFQSYNLIPHQSLKNNVELALTLAGTGRAERRERAEEELDRVGLKEQMHKKPAQLSGGQMQRVAIARALVNHPTIVLADEPTGALDSETGEQVMQLLKEVAQDHLVIMVTHNPELAERYATRIIRLRDGRVKSDSNPFDPERGDLTEESLRKQAETEETPVRAAQEQAEMDEASVRVPREQVRTASLSGRGSRRKPSMSFLTALSLSVSNLLSKKARTILVAFAASIGIAGIALILSLSSGAHDYITRMEETALSEYPIQITASSFSMEAMMGAFSQMRTTTQETESSGSGKVEEQQILGSMLAGSGTNDLASLKRWFDSGYSGIEDVTRCVSYSYGISPQIYLKEGDGYRQVNPDQTMSAVGISMSDNLTSMMSVWNSNDLFCMLPKKEEMYQDSYKLLAGHWPGEADECVLVLLPGGGVPDYLLYTMGLKDASKRDEIITNVVNGDAVDTSMQGSVEYDPEEFLGISFRVLPAYRRYSYDGKLGVWLDESENDERMNQLLDQAQEISICGVVMPEGDSSIGLLDLGIDYRPELMDTLLRDAADSEIVKAQLQDPGTDVLTGAPFGEANGGMMDGMTDMIEIHPEKLPDAVSFDWDGLDKVMEEHGQLSAVQTVRIIRELSRKGESPTLQEALDDFLPALMELVQIDKDKISEAVSFEMDEERMRQMFYTQAQGQDASLSGNLIRFGYADPDEPSMITIYPNDFESKDRVIAILDAYNKTMDDEGYKEKVISYTDYVGSLMSSVTTIIDVITYVLIAFVAVSLVVSSIMIGIITYISVLERRKEIGILRAMGASRGNITQVFNAETFIIGVLAGLFGIALTLLTLIPINIAIHSYTDQPVSAFLPVKGAVILVILCIVLNLIGGFLPAWKASRQDPVAALRSE